MSSGVPFRRYFSSVDSLSYRERQEEEWSPRSPEGDQDSEEENHESNVITITDSSTSSLESPLPRAKNSSFSNSSPSTSLVLYSQGSKVCQEGGYPTDSSKEFLENTSRRRVFIYIYQVFSNGWSVLSQSNTGLRLLHLL